MNITFVPIIVLIIGIVFCVFMIWLAVGRRRDEIVDILHSPSSILLLPKPSNDVHYASYYDVVNRKTLLKYYSTKLCMKNSIVDKRNLTYVNSQFRRSDEIYSQILIELLNRGESRDNKWESAPNP